MEKMAIVTRPTATNGRDRKNARPAPAGGGSSARAVIVAASSVSGSRYQP